MNKEQIKAFNEAKKLFDNRELTENIDDTCDKLEQVYYALSLLIKSTPSQELEKKDIAQLGFVGIGAQKVGELGKCLSLIHEFVFEEEIKLF